MDKKPEQGYVFRPWRKDPKTGEKVWARTYGYRAWKIPVTEEKKSE